MSPLNTRSRELWAAFLMATSASFLLAGYECVRTASNTLFKAEFGAGSLPHAGVIMPIALVGLIWLYAKSLNRYGPRKTLTISYLFCAALLVAGYFLISYGFPAFSAVIIIFRKVYVVILVEQYWSFINSTLSVKTAKKANGPILGIAAIGPIIGGYFVGFTAKQFGTESMLLFTALSFVPALLLMDVAFRFCGEPQEEKKTEEKSFLKDLGIKEMMRSPMLVVLLLLIITTQVLSTALEFNFQTILQEAIPDPDAQTAYSGFFFAHLNLAAFAMNFVAAPLLLKFVPLWLVHIFIPVVHISTAVYAFAAPGLFIAATGLLVFKALDYSVFRAAKEILYIPMSFDARYRAKQIIDVFGYRGGESITSVMVLFANWSGLFFVSFYSLMAIAASGVWLVLLIPILRKSTANSK